MTSALREFILETPQGEGWILATALVPDCPPKKGASRLFLHRKKSKINYQHDITVKVSQSNIPFILHY